MTKLNQRHINAITRAQNLLETGVNVTGNEKLKKSIDNDIRILCELRELLYFALENPTLPFPDDLSEPAEPILNQIEDEPDGAF